MPAISGGCRSQRALLSLSHGLPDTCERLLLSPVQRSAASDRGADTWLAASQCNLGSVNQGRRTLTLGVRRFLGMCAGPKTDVGMQLSEMLQLPLDRQGVVYGKSVPA